MNPLCPPVETDVEKTLTALAQDVAAAETLAGLSDQLKAEMRACFTCSPFLAKSCERHPDWLVETLRQLDQSPDMGLLGRQIDEAVRACGDEVRLKAVMRQLRNRQMLLITWRDLSGRAGLDETLIHLSALADHMIRACLDWHRQALGERHGAPIDAHGGPMELVVLAMGKLGARELNFSSDIDLILAFEADGETGGPRPLSHQEFFTRLARKLHQSLNEVTEDGFVFRTDLRLRPYGDSGPLVMSFAAMEEYYLTQGREWERYAMIKARPVGADTAAGERLLESLRPFVYRRYLDFGVIESLRELKAMINREVARKDMRDNLKLGPGGIREIEFIAQVFQLMRGGRDMELRDRRTQVILQRLGEKDYLEQDEADGLIRAYRFLRNVENRIQMMYDRQEHALPKNDNDRERLMLAMGHADWGAFVHELEGHRAYVQACFDSVFAAPESEAEGEQCGSLSGIWDGSFSPELSTQRLNALGVGSAEALLNRLGQLRKKGVYLRLSNRGRERMDQLMPVLLDLATRQDNPDQTLERVLKLLETIATREVYLALLVENRAAAEQLVRLCSHSQWIADTLAKHPIALDELIDVRTLYEPPDRLQMVQQLTHRIATVDEEDLEEQMNRLRQFKQAAQLRVAAADITGAMPLMVVSDHLTWLAEILIEVALEWAWGHLRRRHGLPRYTVDGVVHTAEFAVIGYGKLGGIELGYGSDLDLVFVHDSRGEQQVSDGERSLDNSVYFTRLAQRFIHIMTTLMPSGVLYEIDARLRPNGASGVLAPSLEALAQYQQESAWTWEHQALVRARPVAGGKAVRAGFEQLRQQTLSWCRTDPQLREDVLQMRDRMRKELDKSSETVFDLKQGVGGVVDIEFMVQYCVLKSGCKFPQLLRYTDNIRILESLAACGLMSDQESQQLMDAYRGFRRRLHRQVLQGEKGLVADAEFGQERRQVQTIWKRIFAQGTNGEQA